jgi:endonuclease YncB( thermonuclease family)
VQTDRFSTKAQNIPFIRSRYSWHFKKYTSDQDYASAERYVRKNKLGLWKLDEPAAAWNWREK